MKVTAVILMLLIGYTAFAQQATKEEIAYHTRVLGTLNAALPAKYKNWDVQLLSEGEENNKDGLALCDTPTCWRTEQATATFDAYYKDEGLVALQNQKAAIPKTDPKKMERTDALDIQIQNSYFISVKLFANYQQGDESFHYCKPGGYQKLTPAAGWDAFYYGTTVGCQPDTESLADMSFMVMGPLPEIKEIFGKYDNVCQGKPVFPLNQALRKGYKVQNIVMKIQGSKESVLEFMKSVDTAALRKLLTE